MKNCVPSFIGRLLLASPFLFYGCATQHKLNHLRTGNLSARLSLDGGSEGRNGGSFNGRNYSMPEADNPDKVLGDTLTITNLDGREMLIMKAMRDESTGELVATQVLNAAVVSARFRNVAERHGKVDLGFCIMVPDTLLERKWQLRFEPFLIAAGDSIPLEPLIITGDEFRRQQLRGYQQYQRFLNSIVRDSLHLVDWHQLESFLERNLPQIYKYRNDSSYVSDEQFRSEFGVSGREALEHYTNKLLQKHNAAKISRKDKMKEKYVKVPIIKEGIRLDTVIRNPEGLFCYHYVHTFAVKRALRKVDVVLQGNINDYSGHLYTIPPGKPLSFYISSLSTLADNRKRYLTKIVGRRAEANMACDISFAAGSHELRSQMDDNAMQMARIKKTLRQLMTDDVFELDSVSVTAGCSPDGAYNSNALLAGKRAEAVCGHFRAFMEDLSDSLFRESTILINENGSISRQKKQETIKLRGKSIAENWSLLDELVEEDPEISDAQKQRYGELRKIKDPDKREKKIQEEDFGKYIKKNIYPKLRRVQFVFNLHRKGMIKDTVHTTVIDSVYMAGVEALKERDYNKAVELLRPYNDYNCAIAYMALDYNASAIAILEKLQAETGADRERSRGESQAEARTDREGAREKAGKRQGDARLDYLLAILHQRRGNTGKAVEYYMHACERDPSYIHRGNLDPEISGLIKAYGLNR